MAQALLEPFDLNGRPILAEKGYDSDPFVCCRIEEGKPLFSSQGKDLGKGSPFWTKPAMGSSTAPHLCRRSAKAVTITRIVIFSSPGHSFIFFFRGGYNCKCDDCSAHQPNLKHCDSCFSLAPCLSALEARGMVNDIFSALYAAGEPCLNEKRFSLYEHCREKPYILDIFSNCSVFDEALFELAQDTLYREKYHKVCRESFCPLPLDAVRNEPGAPEKKVKDFP